jgi:hypothetical protein
MSKSRQALLFSSLFSSLVQQCNHIRANRQEESSYMKRQQLNIFKAQGGETGRRAMFRESEREEE